MKNRRRPSRAWRWLPLLLVGLGIILPVGVEADDQVSVKPVWPSEQITSHRDGFALKLRAGSQQTLTINVANQSRVPVKLSVRVGTAQTSPTMHIDYGMADRQKQAGHTYDLANLIQGPKEITLPAQRARNLHYTVRLPKEPFQGVLAGRIGFMVDQQNDGTGRQGQADSNEDYVHSVKLSLREMSGQAVKPVLALPSVKAGTYDGRNAVLATVVNQEPVFVEGLTSRAVVINQKTGAQVLVREQSGQAIAPNSRFIYPLALGESKRWQAGPYQLRLTLQNKKSHWQMQKTFAVSKEEAERLNQHDIFLEAPGSQNLVWLIIGVIIVGLLSIIILVWRRQATKRGMQ